MHFIQPLCRDQSILMNKLDDLVNERHYVRLIDTFVDYFMTDHKDLFLIKGMHYTGRRAYSPPLPHD